MFEGLTAQTASEGVTAVSLLYVFLLAFLLSTAIAFSYIKTFRGLSYSRNYIQSIILISILAAVVIQSVGDSLARGIGIMAAMAIIRFRTNFKDPRDTLFLFAGVATGISCGAYAFGVALVGASFFCVTVFILHISPFGPNAYFDGMLRFNMGNNSAQRQALESSLNKYCRSFSLITLRELKQGDKLDYAYHVKIRKGRHESELVAALQQLPELDGVHLLMQEATVDI